MSLTNASCLVNSGFKRSLLQTTQFALPKTIAAELTNELSFARCALEELSQCRVRTVPLEAMLTRYIRLVAFCKRLSF